MKILLPLAAALALTLPAKADEAMDAAKAFINNPVQQRVLDDMLSPEVIMAQFQAMGLNLPPEKVQVMVNIVTEELDKIRPTMEEAMIEGAATSFTVDELNAMNEFYSSPLGASAMSKMTPYMQSTMGSIGPALQQMQGNVARRVQAEFQ